MIGNSKLVSLILVAIILHVNATANLLSKSVVEDKPNVVRDFDWMTNNGAQVQNNKFEFNQRPLGRMDKNQTDMAPKDLKKVVRDFDWMTNNGAQVQNNKFGFGKRSLEKNKTDIDTAKDSKMVSRDFDGMTNNGGKVQNNKFGFGKRDFDGMTNNGGKVQNNKFGFGKRDFDGMINNGGKVQNNKFDFRKRDFDGMKNANGTNVQINKIQSNNATDSKSSVKDFFDNDEKRNQIDFTKKPEKRDFDGMTNNGGKVQNNKFGFGKRDFDGMKNANGTNVQINKIQLNNATDSKSLVKDFFDEKNTKIDLAKKKEKRNFDGQTNNAGKVQNINLASLGDFWKN